jgi:hypothetical protein
LGRADSNIGYAKTLVPLTSTALPGETRTTPLPTSPSGLRLVLRNVTA